MTCCTCKIGLAARLGSVFASMRGRWLNLLAGMNVYETVLPIYYY
jgi:hypothetical protein